MSFHVLVFPSWYPETPSDVKGVFFRDQALALSEYGHKVGVVTTKMRSLRALGGGEKDTAGLAFEVDEGIPTYRRQVWARFPRFPYGNYRLWRGAAWKLLARYVHEQGWPDVIHAHSAIYAGAVAAEWGRKNGIPVVLTEHSSGFARRVFRHWQLKLAEGGACGADACLAVSPSLCEVLGDQLPRSRGRWMWVPNLVADRFRADEKAGSRAERPVRFLNLSLMEKKKGQADLLEAFARAFGGAPEAVELWIGGDGPSRGALEAQAEELGIANRVLFLGKVPPADVPALLGRVDALVVASHYETFGLVAAEALMAGVPVVATRCGGPECIVEEGDGRLVSPRDPKSLAAAMAELAETAVDVDRRAIAERAKARFSKESVVRQLAAIYEDVLARYPQSSRRA